MKNHVLKEIILDAMKDILSKNMDTESTYIAIKRLFLLDELELRILLDSVGRIKQKQIEDRKRELAG